MTNTTIIPPKTVYAKLLCVQKKVGAISKDARNPFFKSNYFDINKIIETVKPLLDENGLLVMQPLVTLGDATPAIATIFIDPESGESLKFITPLPIKEDPQKMGSLITYFRRFCLQSALFLQAEDDDGNDAAGKTPPPVVEEKPKKSAFIDKGQIKKVGELAKALGKKEEDMLKWANAKSIAKIRKEKGTVLIASMEAELDKKFAENTEVKKKE